MEPRILRNSCIKVPLCFQMQNGLYFTCICHFLRLFYSHTSSIPALLIKSHWPALSHGLKWTSKRCILYKQMSYNLENEVWSPWSFCQDWPLRTWFSIKQICKKIVNQNITLKPHAYHSSFHLIIPRISRVSVRFDITTFFITSQQFISWACIKHWLEILKNLIFLSPNFWQYVMGKSDHLLMEHYNRAELNMAFFSFPKIC